MISGRLSTPVCETFEARFGVPLRQVYGIHGRDVVVRPGWLALRRETGATVLAVLAHLDGRIGVVTIQPPLPPPGPDQASDSAACRESLERLLVGYARHFPDQCRSVAG